MWVMFVYLNTITKFPDNSQETLGGREQLKYDFTGKYHQANQLLQLCGVGTKAIVHMCIIVRDIGILQNTNCFLIWALGL